MPQQHRYDIKYYLLGLVYRNDAGKLLWARNVTKEDLLVKQRSIQIHAYVIWFEDGVRYAYKVNTSNHRRAPKDPAGRRP